MTRRSLLKRALLALVVAVVGPAPAAAPAGPPWEPRTVIKFGPDLLT